MYVFRTGFSGCCIELRLNIVQLNESRLVFQKYPYGDSSHELLGVGYLGLVRVGE